MIFGLKSVIIKNITKKEEQKMQYKSNNLRMRLAQDSDFQDFIELFKTLYSFGKNQKSQKTQLYSYIDYEEMFEELEESNDTYLTMLEIDKKVIGMAIISKITYNDEQFTILHIEEFVIKRQFQQKGYGREFFEKIESWANLKGVQAIDLICYYPGARAFWKKQGFKSYIYIYFTKKL